MADRLYIRGFPDTYTRDDLKSKFSIFGRIKKLYIVSKESKLYAIARYYNPDNAKKAIDALNGHVSDGITWFVTICEKLNVRKRKFISDKRVKKMENYTKTLYITDYPEYFTEDNFREVFGKYGNIASIKIDDKRTFLTFDEPCAAETANKEIKPLIIEGIRVYVAKLAQKGKISNFIVNKKQRKASKNEEKKAGEGWQDKGTSEKLPDEGSDEGPGLFD